MKNYLLILSFFLISNLSYSQVAVNTTGASAAPTAILDVRSTTKGFLPPRMTETERNAIMNPEEGLMIYNITTKKPNYFNGTEWKSFDGNLSPNIGESYGGGVIAYILQPSDPGYILGQIHGLIASPNDQSIGSSWGCQGFFMPGADGTAIGTGNLNTIQILNGCSTAGIAAKICSDLVLNGYSDWYLPSKDELNKLYLNRNAIGGFAIEVYWTSTESDENLAWNQNFNDGVQQVSQKGPANNNVRAIRTF